MNLLEMPPNYPANWIPLGCYTYVGASYPIFGADTYLNSNSTVNRVLPYGATVAGGVTVKSCTTARGTRWQASDTLMKVVRIVLRFSHSES